MDILERCHAWIGCGRVGDRTDQHRGTRAGNGMGKPLDESHRRSWTHRQRAGGELDIPNHLNEHGASIKRKHIVLLENIRAGNGGTSWAGVEALLVALGATRHERSGAAVLFELNGVVLRVHRVHGRRDCGTALVVRIRDFLVEAGVL